MKYRAYRTKSDSRFHFQFTTDGGDSILNGGPFVEKEACFDGIRAVMTAAGNPTNYTQQTSDGKTYFTINVDGKPLARSVDYDSAAAASAGAALTQKEGPTATAKGSGDSKSASGGAASSTSKDDYKPLAFYESKIAGTSDGFDKFAADGEYYFTYNMDGMVVMISEGYSSDKSRDNGIASVTKNMTNADRYKQEVHSNGKSYFNLRAGNNQEIATSRWFDSDGSRDTAISLLTSGGKGNGKMSALFSSAKKSDGAIYPDYKALNFYQERIEGTDYGFDSFTDDEKHYFTLNHEGKPLLISETYQSESGRENGISSVKKNVKKENRFVAEEHPNGKYYFRLLAGNKQEIATSRWFDSAKDRDKAIAWLISTGGTRKRKKATRTKEAGERVYVNQGLSYPCSDITYDTFKSGGNQKYYFVFKDKEGKAILINGDVRGYATPEDAAAAIERVKKYGPDAKNYLRKESKTGKGYFFIKDENDKSVARGSLFYSDKDAMEATIKMLACGAGLSAAPKAAATAPASNAVVDDYLPCEAYNGGAGFHTFYNEERKEHYFAFNNNSGATYLRSEGYSAESGRDNGIESIKKNAPIDERWGTATALNDKYHYYYLKAGNHQEIGRSCYYKSAAEMNTAFAWVRGGDSMIGKGAGMHDGKWMTANAIAAATAPAKAAPAPAAASTAVVDDYLPCEDYTGGEWFHTFYNEDRKEYYFAYNNGAGKTFLRSEGYTSAAGRDNGIESVKKNSPIEARWGTGTALNDKYHYYNLKAGNNQEIARSCYYKSEAEMLADMAWVRGGDSVIGKGAAMFAGAWMTGNAISGKKAEEAKLAAEKAEAVRLAAEKEAEAKRIVQEKERQRKLALEEEKRKAAEAEKARLVEEARIKAEKEAAATKAAALAAKQAAKPQSIEDDYLPCESYSGAKGFHTFTHKESGEHYFAYNAENGKTLLRSEGYTSTSARDNGIESVKKNAPIEERWGTDTALNGKYHYYTLKAGNNKEIARSCYYKDKAAMMADWKAAKGIGAVAKVAAKPQAIEDDYLPCDDYAGPKGFHKFTHKDSGEHYFAYNDKNEKTILRSEGYTTTKARDNGIASVKKNAPIKERWGESTALNGKYHYYFLKAGNNKEIARSCYYKDKAAMIAGWGFAKGIGATAGAAAVGAAAIAAIPKKVTPPPPPPPPKKKVVAAAAPPPIVEEKGGFNWLWLLPLLLVLAGLLWWMKGCDGCTPKPPPPPPIVDPIDPPPPPPPAAPLCADGAGLGLTPNSTSFNIANFLADPNHSFPKTFEADNITFSKRSSSLNRAAKKQLDNIVLVMKDCCGADAKGNDRVRLDITGFINGERGTTRASKETGITLDDKRAQKVYDYLKSRGIPESQLNYSGGGNGDSRTVQFTLRR